MADKVFRVVTIVTCSACSERFAFDRYVRAADAEDLKQRLDYLKYDCPRCGDKLPKQFPERPYSEEIPKLSVPSGAPVL